MDQQDWLQLRAQDYGTVRALASPLTCSSLAFSLFYLYTHSFIPFLPPLSFICSLLITYFVPRCQCQDTFVLEGRWPSEPQRLKNEGLGKILGWWGVGEGRTRKSLLRWQVEACEKEIVPYMVAANVKRTPEHETRLQPPGIIKRRRTCVSRPWWRLGQEGNHMIGREKPWGTRK